MLSSYVQAQIRLRAAADGLRSRMVDPRSESGQVSVEYIGFFIVIAVVMVALSGFGDPIANAFKSLIIDNIKGLFGKG